MKKYVLTAMLSLASTFAYADIEDKKTISGIYVNKGIYSISVNNPGSSVNCGYRVIILSRPEAVTDPAVLQAWYSGAMASLRAGSLVTIDYTNAGGACSVNQINFY